MAAFLSWIDEMQRRDQRIVDKCKERIEQLSSMGHELRRPASDTLRDGIHELRIGFQSVNYRILYFFHGRTAAILAHGLTKKAQVPDKDINIAIERRKKYIADPEEHQEIVGEDDEQD